MTRTTTALLTSLAMIAFAGNSLLCRQALDGTAIDAATFTSVRLGSGALTLVAIVWWQMRPRRTVRPAVAAAMSAGSWWSAATLVAYAVCFSYAYLQLTAGTGALLLFGTVQVTMIGWGVWTGDRLGPQRLVGVLVAFAGLVWLVLPGLAAPPLDGALLMIAAGVGWGVYSLRGRGSGDATRTTAGNFVRTVPFAVGLSVGAFPWWSFDLAGIGYAVASGAIASGLGYVIWYAALRGLRPASAASVQLSVPVITAVGGALLLGEAITLRLVVASVAVLGGIGLVIQARASGRT